MVGGGLAGLAAAEGTPAMVLKMSEKHSEKSGNDDGAAEAEPGR